MSNEDPIIPMRCEDERENASALVPVVYDELRRLAAAQLVDERPNQTLDVTALVHEAFLKLACSKDQLRWRSRSHFLAAAAESMRRILVDAARKKSARKRTSEGIRLNVDPDQMPSPTINPDVLAVDEALVKLTKVDPMAAELVKLRYFAGLTIPESAEVLGISPRTADAWWAYARAWLLAELKPE